VVVVRDEIEHEALGLKGLDVVYQPDFALAKAFETAAKPHAFALNHERVVVATSTPNTFRLLRQLAERIPAYTEHSHIAAGEIGKNELQRRGGENHAVR
jgi:hypothetical protein